MVFSCFGSLIMTWSVVPSRIINVHPSPFVSVNNLNSYFENQLFSGSTSYFGFTGNGLFGSMASSCGRPFGHLYVVFCGSCGFINCNNTPPSGFASSFLKLPFPVAGSLRISTQSITYIINRLSVGIAVAWLFSASKYISFPVFNKGQKLNATASVNIADLCLIPNLFNKSTIWAVWASKSVPSVIVLAIHFLPILKFLSRKLVKVGSAGDMCKSKSGPGLDVSGSVLGYFAGRKVFM